jgi:hypothetical protein
MDVEGKEYAHFIDNAIYFYVTRIVDKGRNDILEKFLISFSHSYKLMLITCYAVVRRKLLSPF